MAIILLFQNTVHPIVGYWGNCHNMQPLGLTCVVCRQSYPTTNNYMLSLSPTAHVYSTHSSNKPATSKLQLCTSIHSQLHIIGLYVIKPCCSY